MSDGVNFFLFLFFDFFVLSESLVFSFLNIGTITTSSVLTTADHLKEKKKELVKLEI